MMRCFRSVSLTVVCLTMLSCAPSIRKGCGNASDTWIHKGEWTPMMNETSGLLRYNMTIDFMRKHFSGLLLVKNTAEGHSRILFSTHFGLSLFDFEITPDSLIVHHCVEPLKKRKLLDLFYRDFLVLQGGNLPEKMKVTVYDCASPVIGRVYRLTTLGRRGYYRVNVPGGLIQEIQLGSGIWKTRFLSLPDHPEGKKGVRILHGGLGLSIGLDVL